MSSNNNKQPPDLTESLLVFDEAQDYDGISLVKRRSRDVNPPEKNDNLGISGIIQPDVTTPNLSHSDELTIGLLLDCAERGENRGNQPPPSICKVSRILRDVSVRSFIPQLVSIGPIHRENKKLKEFKWMKECYLNDLLKRSDFTPKEILEACLLKVNTLIPQIRVSYAGVKKKYSDDKLARMMVMDGCFILEFCFKHEDEENLLPNKMQNTRIAMDLMLLENQVPFFVLQALFNCCVGKVTFTLSDVLDEYLAPYIQLFRSDLLPEKKSILSNIRLFCLPEKNPNRELRKTISTEDVDHVLGYLHKRYQPVVAKSWNNEERKENLVYHSIVELDRSGMNFKPHQEGNWSLTIKFQSSYFLCLPWIWCKPTLLMPTLVLDDFSELILRNFIAYEQSFCQDRDYFTSYAHAMDMLIDTQEDIAKLADSKVLVSELGSSKEAADIINKISRNISITGFNYTEEFKKMDKYYSRCWREHIAQLRLVYFSNPWSIIALVVAIIVSLATVVATVFAVLDYYR